MSHKNPLCPCGRAAPFMAPPGRCVKHKGMALPAVLDSIREAIRAREAARPHA